MSENMQDEQAAGPAKSPAKVYHEVLGAPPAQQDPQSMHHGGSFHQYMGLKVSKLREQYESNSLHTTTKSNIFQGVSIFVDGYTRPSAQELKQIMMLHGGRYENYLYRDHVTHFICSNLPDTKLKQLAHERNPLPVVRPEWIVASLNAGRLLPIKDFQLQPLAAAPGQKKLADFAQHTNNLPAAHELYPQLQQPGPQQAQGSDDADAAQQRAGPDEQPKQPGQVQQPHEDGRQGVGKPPGGGSSDMADAELAGQHANNTSALTGSPSAADPATTATTAAGVMAMGGSGSIAAPPANPGAVQGPGPAVQGPAQVQWDEAEMRAAQELCAQLRAACDLLRGAPKSSWDNPKFMEDFFRSSRLHFIGRWKARIEALMANLDGSGPQPTHAPTTKGSIFQPRGAASAHDPALERAIIHIDMDCFFASVAESLHPILRGKPLVVSHSASAQGRGEVSAANYPARAYGIHAVMTIGEAKRRCPHLLVVPYMFDKYEDVSEQVYKILLQYSNCVQPLSCDEAYLDVTGLGDPEELAQALRQDIQLSTGCSASAGIGPNLLLARLATKRAKPNGQYRLRGGQQALDYIADLPVDALPGVGWSLSQKLKDLFGISTVRQVWSTSKEQLQRQLGTKTGLALWQHAHGRDDRVVEPPKARKSVGAEVNWGIRFTSQDDFTTFLKELCGEVSQRMKTAGVKGKCFTLKIKRRQEGAPQPFKMLGHGACDNLSRSVTLGAFTDSPADILRECTTLAVALAVPPEEMRGVGIAVTKLNTDAAAAAARPSVAAPAKLAAPAAPSTYNPHAMHWEPPWVGPSDTDRPADTRAPAPTTRTTLQSPTSLNKLLAATGRAAPTAPGAERPPGNNGQESTPHDGNQGKMSSPMHNDVQRCEVAAAGSGTKPRAADRPSDAAGPSRVVWEPQSTRKRLFTCAGEDLDTAAMQPGPGLPEQQQVAKRAKVDVQGSAAPGVPQPVAAGRGGGGRVAAAGKAGRQSRLTVAAPAVSEIDPSVLAELPEDVKRELRSVYGLALPGLRPQQQAAARGKQGHGGRRQGGSPPQSRAQSKVQPSVSGNVSKGRPAVSGQSSGQGVSVGRPLTTASMDNTLNSGRAVQGSGRAAALSVEELDPEVLAALPEDMRREVLLSVSLVGAPPPGPARSSTVQPIHMAVPGSIPAARLQGSSAAAHRPPAAGADPAARQQGAPLLTGHTGRASNLGQGSAVTTQSVAKAALFCDEAPPEILRAFKRMVLTLAARGADASSSGAQDLSAGAQAAGQGPATDPEAGEARCAEVHNRLLLGCEHLVQWALSKPWDLETLGRVLGLLEQLKTQVPVFAPLAKSCAEVLQQHAVENYGAVLKPLSLL